jgi:hypothetical protein
VEIYIDTPERERNVAIFEALREQREEIERAVNMPLEWDTLEGRRAMRISAYAPFAAVLATSLIRG